MKFLQQRKRIQEGTKSTVQPIINVSEMGPILHRKKPETNFRRLDENFKRQIENKKRESSDL